MSETSVGPCAAKVNSGFCLSEVVVSNFHPCHHQSSNWSEGPHQISPLPSRVTATRPDVVNLADVVFSRTRRHLDSLSKFMLRRCSGSSAGRQRPLPYSSTLIPTRPADRIASKYTGRTFSANAGEQAKRRGGAKPELREGTGHDARIKLKFAPPKLFERRTCRGPGKTRGRTRIGHELLHRRKSGCPSLLLKSAVSSVGGLSGLSDLIACDQFPSFCGRHLSRGRCVDIVTTPDAV